MTKATLTTLCIVLAVIVALFAFGNWAQLWHHIGWQRSITWQEQHVTLDKKDGLPFVPAHQQIIVERGGTEMVVSADPGNRPTIDITVRQSGSASVQQAPARTSQQPTRRQTPSTSTRAPAPCDPSVSQTGCPPASGGLKLIKRRN